MKRLGRLALLLLVLSISIFATVSCGGGDSVDGISVKEEGMPQLVFVLGEQLDLSNGLLTVTDDEGTRDIPMDSEGVSVSGYDRNKLGEQTITLSYGGKSTELKVTVVERMTVVNQTSDYLVGDELDLTKGSVKITRNDGTNYTVKLNSTNVTVTGFSSKSAGSVTVNVSYDTGVDIFNTSYNANIYSVEDVEFHRPNKVAYDSHDGGELDLSGGYVTLKGNGGALEKDIQLTSDLVTYAGFDLSAVNEENSPYTQEITVTYNGEEFKYNVKLTYTDISKFNDNSSEFLKLDFTGEDFPEVSDELGKLALELMELYLGLSKAEMTHISNADALAVARAAVVYGLEAVSGDILELESAFTISGLEPVLTCESYEAVEAAIVALKNYDSDLYTVTPILSNLLERFAEEEIIPEVFFGYYGVPEAQVYTSLVDVFEYMLDLYDTLSVIPENWQAAGVNAYATEIEQLWSFIRSSGYTDATSSQVYYYVSYWRTDYDLFDLLYTYYYEKGDTETITSLSSLGIPRVLEDVYYYIALAMDQIYQLSQYSVTDTSQLFYSYYYALRLADEIKNGDDQMAKDLYATLPLNAMLGMDNSEIYTFDYMLEYIRIADGGIQYCAGPLLGIPEYHELLDKYMDILCKLIENETYEGSDQYGVDVEALFALYVALSPGQQINFITSLSPFYTMGYPPLMFDDSGQWADYANLFVVLVNEYYRGKLGTDSAKAAYDNLVLAIELYAQRGIYEGTLDEFKTRIDTVAATYASMSAADQAVFDLYLGSVYEKYTTIRARYNDPVVDTDLGDWEDNVNGILEAISAVEISYNLLSEYDAYNLFFSAYERLDDLVKYLLENAPTEIVEAYYHENLYTGEYDPGDGSGVQTYAYTLDYIVNTYRSLYISYLLTFQESSYIYDDYVALNMGEFLSSTYDLVWMYLFYGDEDPETVDFDKARVIEIMTEFTNLTYDQQTLFVIMEGENGFYFTILSYFFEDMFTEGAADVAYKFVELEQQILMYKTLGDAESLATLETLYTELQTLYTALEGEDKTSFADLEALYSTIVEKCESVLAEADTAVDAAA